MKKCYVISEVSASKAMDESFKRIEVEAVRSLYQATSGLAKLFYLLLILVLFGVLSYEISKTIRDFRKSPVSSSLKIVTFNEMTLPQIYICPSHRFSYETLRFNESQVAFALKLNNKLSILYNTNPEKWFTTKIDEDLDWRYENLTFKDLKDMWLSFDADSIKRIFRNNEYRESITIKRQIPLEQFRHVYDPYYGICYTLNATDMPQMIEGQSLTFFTTLRRHYYQKEQHTSSKVPIFRGFHVSFAEKLDPTNMAANFLIAPANRLTKLAMRKRDVSLLPGKQSCLPETATPDLAVLNVGYSRKSCRLDCALRLLIGKCSCLPGIDQAFLLRATLQKYKYCSVRQTNHCRQMVVGDSVLTADVASCPKSCASPCNFRQIYTRVSHLNLNGDGFFDFPATKGNSTPTRDVWLDVAIFQIFYNDFSVEAISSAESMSIHDVISNLGGQINLWLGISMFTLVQIPTVLILMLSFHLWHS